MVATLHVPNPAWETWLRANPLPGAALFGSRTAAEALGLLTLHLGRQLSVRDVVLQLGTNLESTQRALARLVAAHVVSEVRTGRRRDVLMEPGPQAMALRQLALRCVVAATAMVQACGFRSRGDSGHERALLGAQLLVRELGRPDESRLIDELKTRVRPVRRASV